MGVLASYQTPRIDVPLGENQVVSLRGLDLDDFSVLLQAHLPSITKAAELFRASQRDIYSSANLQSFVLTVAKDFPGLVSEVISIAADEPEAKDVKMGLGFQLAALQAVVKLTLEEAGGLGNLIASLAALSKGALQNASERTQK